MIARRPARRGVSLIEVLLATAIFFIALSALGVLIQTATDSSIDADWTNRCSRLARSRLADVEQGTGEVGFGQSTQGEGVDGERTYQWAVTFTDANAFPASEVRVRVWITSKSRTVEASVTQVILDPSLQNGAAALTAPSSTTEAAP